MAACCSVESPANCLIEYVASVLVVKVVEFNGIDFALDWQL
jgi:hypothetical protein